MSKALIWLCMAASAAAQSAALPKGLYAVFTTSAGNFTAKLYEKDTPETVKTFVGLAEGTKAWREPQTGRMVKRPLYKDLLFYRVIPGEIIQSGSPTGSTMSACGFRIRDEFLPGLRFDRSGKLAMANSGDENSGSCQFFITAGPASQWNGKFAIFGNVVEGMEVVEKINRAPVHGDSPVNPVKLIGVTIQRVGK